MSRWVGVLFGLLGFPFSTRVLIFGLQPFIPWEYLVAGPVPTRHYLYSLSVLWSVRVALPVVIS